MNSITNQMFSPLGEFSLRAKKIIERHIKSAVLIDDDWPEYCERKEIIDADELITEKEKETEVDVSEDEDEDEDSNIAMLAAVKLASIKSDVMGDAKRLLKIQDCFTKKGVICTGFKYTAKEKDSAPKLAKNADIVILDWNFASDEGAGAVEILKELMDGQLRFICIFTDQHDLISIKKRILEDVCADSSPVDTATDFKANNFVFTLRNKAVKNVESLNESLEENLFDDAIEHLSMHYRGFLQLGMLEMTSCHRSSLLAHLARFSPEFDAALLSESALAHSPVDMAGNLRALLIDEWRIALESSAQQTEMCILGKAGRAAYAAGLKSNCAKVTANFLLACATALGIKFERQVVESFFAIPGGELKRKFDSQIGTWLDAGATTPAPSPRALNEKDAAKMTVATLYALSHSDDVNRTPTQEEIYRYIFRLDALFNQQLLLPEELTQGTILKFDDENYLICITPLCDTARLEEKFYAYSFLGATRAKNSEMLSKKSDYCVFMEGDEPVCLHVDVKRPYVYEVGPVERKIQLGKAVAMRHRLLSLGKLPCNSETPINDISTSSQGEKIIEAAMGESRISESRIATTEASKQSDETFFLTVVGQLRTDFFLMLTAASASNAVRVGVNRMEFIRFHKN